jgi:transposase
MGIDEIALVKGKGNYCALLIDLEKYELIGILERRTQSEIEKKLLSWGTEVWGQIEELMPNAQVVADRFHVMVQVNQELDSQIKQEKRQLENSLKTAKSPTKKESYAHVLERLKKSKYALLKNEKDLNEELSSETSGSKRGFSYLENYARIKRKNPPNF